MSHAPHYLYRWWFPWRRPPAGRSHGRHFQTWELRGKKGPHRPGQLGWHSILDNIPKTPASHQCHDPLSWTYIRFLLGEAFQSWVHRPSNYFSQWHSIQNNLHLLPYCRHAHIIQCPPRPTIPQHFRRYHLYTSPCHKIPLSVWSHPYHPRRPTTRTRMLHG